MKVIVMFSLVVGALALAANAQTQIQVLYRNKSSYKPYRIVHDSGHVYWTDGYDLMAVVKKTADVMAVGKSTTIDSALAESGGYIYKLDRSRIVRFKSAGGNEEVVYQKPNYFADMMTVNPAGVIVWLTNQENAGLLQTMSAPGAEVQTVASGEKTSNFGAIIADTTSIYWVEPQTGALKSVSVKGGRARTISHCDANYLVQDDAYLYFIDRKGSTDALMRASKKDFTVKVLGKLPINSALAIDEAYVYFAGWSNRSAATGYVGRMPKTGGMGVHLVDHLGTPNALIVDNSNVYFADDENNMVGRIPK